jgi:hypothetical protein
MREIRVGDTVEYRSVIGGKLYKAKVLELLPRAGRFVLNVFEGTTIPSYVSQETWVLSSPYPQIKTKFLEGYPL